MALKNGNRGAQWKPRGGADSNLVLWCFYCRPQKAKAGGSQPGVWDLVMSSRTGIRLLIIPTMKGDTSGALSLQCTNWLWATQAPRGENRGHSCACVPASEGCPGLLESAESEGPQNYIKQNYSFYGLLYLNLECLVEAAKLNCLADIL